MASFYSRPLAGSVGTNWSGGNFKARREAADAIGATLPEHGGGGDGTLWWRTNRGWAAQNPAKRPSALLFADTTGLSELAFHLRYGVGAEVFAAVQTQLVVIAERVAEDAKVRAELPKLAKGPEQGQISTRIADSIKVRRTKGLQVQVIAGGPNAPHAAPLENKGRGNVTHPTFGHDPWTNKNSRPAYLHPAMEAQRAEMEPRIQEVVSKAAERALATVGPEGTFTVKPWDTAKVRGLL